MLIDGEFGKNLSVWHKELLYALSRPYVRRVIGAASMGAIRAADMWRYGMVGIGRTVFDGTHVEDFKVTILGVLQNMIGPNRNLILARLDG